MDEEAKKIESALGPINAQLFKDIRAEAEALLSIPKAGKGRGKKKKGTTRDARLKSALDLVARCGAAMVPPPEALIQFLSEAVGVSPNMIPADRQKPKLTSVRQAIAEADAAAWGSTMKSPRELAGDIGVAERTVRNFRKHAIYGVAVMACLEPLILKRVGKDWFDPDKEGASKGWDDIINVEAKIRQWAEGQEYPTDMFPAIERVFNDATELAAHLIKKRLIPAAILEKEGLRKSNSE